MIRVNRSRRVVLEIHRRIRIGGTDYRVEIELGRDTEPRKGRWRKARTPRGQELARPRGRERIRTRGPELARPRGPELARPRIRARELRARERARPPLRLVIPFGREASRHETNPSRRETSASRHETNVSHHEASMRSGDDPRYPIGRQP